MKKILIGALLGGIVLFAWQTLSWTILQLHYPAEQYSPRQDTVLAFLNSQFQESGQYLLPNVPKNADSKQREELMNKSNGQPWAMVSYHEAMNTSMPANIVRGLFVNIILMGLFCWILTKLPTTGFGTVFSVSLITGLIAFLNEIYTVHIWFQTFDLMAHFADALAGWGLSGLVLGWWFSRKPASA